MEDIETINRSIDLIYSPDEDEYYFQRFPSQEVSQSFDTREDAIKAHKSNILIWS